MAATTQEVIKLKIFLTNKIREKWSSRLMKFTNFSSNIKAAMKYDSNSFIKIFIIIVIRYSYPIFFFDQIFEDVTDYKTGCWLINFIYSIMCEHTRRPKVFCINESCSIQPVVACNICLKATHNHSI